MGRVMRCNICPLYHYSNSENGMSESCDIFGDGWDSRFQYERNKQVVGCYIDTAYIRKIEKERDDYYANMAWARRTEDE